jgi:hypothetical protein
MTTATLIVRHRVDDYATWRSAYDGADALRQQYGCTGEQVTTDPADQQEVYVLHWFPSVEQARAFAESDELREAMGRAGVSGAPRIEITVEA